MGGGQRLSVPCINLRLLARKLLSSWPCSATSCFALFLIAGWLPLQCATLERLSLDDMIARSTAIVRGKVTSSYAAFSGPVIYTHYTIQVSEQYKGAGQASVEVVIPGGTAGNLRQSFAGAPTLTPGIGIRSLFVHRKIGAHHHHRSDAGPVHAGGRLGRRPCHHPLRQPRADARPAYRPSGEGSDAQHAVERSARPDCGGFARSRGAMKRSLRIAISVLAAAAIFTGGLSLRPLSPPTRIRSSRSTKSSI